MDFTSSDRTDLHTDLRYDRRRPDEAFGEGVVHPIRRVIEISTMTQWESLSSFFSVVFFLFALYNASLLYTIELVVASTPSGSVAIYA